MVQINAIKIKKFSSKANGQYYDIRYNKSLDSIYLQSELNYQLLDDKQTVRIYKPASFNIYSDSIRSVLNTLDSLGNLSADTLFAKFSEQQRKPGKFDASINPSTKTIDIKNTFELTFSKPVYTFNPKAIQWKADTIYQADLDSNTHFRWNHTRTKLRFDATMDTTSYLQFQRAFHQQPDSSQTDTTKTKPVATKPEKAEPKQPTLSRTIDLVFDKGAFISIESDTLQELKQNYTFVQQKQTGKLIIQITTQIPSYRVQLINKQYQVIKEYPQGKRIQADNLPPSDYGIRILIDSNQDGKWSYGNILKNTEPEPIYIHPEFTSLRANWEVTMDITF